jgi:hypothetical protein
VQRTSGPFADVPVLVLSGDLDPNTPTEEGHLAARQFRDSRVIEVPNVAHVPESHSGCAAAIEMDFIRTLQVGDTSRLADIPPFRSRSKSIRLNEHDREQRRDLTVSHLEGSTDELRVAERSNARHNISGRRTNWTEARDRRMGASRPVSI